MKKLLGIVVLGLLLSGNAYAENKIINVSCKESSVALYDKNHIDTGEGIITSESIVYTFDSKNKKIIKVNFEERKNLPIIINDNIIHWHVPHTVDAKLKKAYGVLFNMNDPHIQVNVFEINRYTGYLSQNVYILNSYWTLRYLGKLNESGQKTKSSEDASDPVFFKNAKINLDKGIAETKSLKPQKSIIHSFEGKSVCTKVEKKKIF